MANLTWKQGALVPIFQNGDQLTGLQNGQNAITTNSASPMSSGVFDNTLVGELLAVFDWDLRFSAGVPTVGSIPIEVAKLYILPAVDGTDFADGATGTGHVPPDDCYVGSFYTKYPTTSGFERVTLGTWEPIKLPPLKMKFLIVNTSGFRFHASQGGDVNMQTFHVQIA